MNSIHRSVMIFSDSQEKAEIQLNEIAYNLDEVILIRKKDFLKTETRTFQARKYSEAARGFRFQDVYIDHSIDLESQWEILTKLIPPYLSEKDRNDENYRWNDHLQFFKSK